MKKFLREYRAAYPDRDIQLIFLPRGSPYLNVVEECWNLMKKAVAQHYYYPRFDDFRWAVSAYHRTARFSMDMEAFLYRNPWPHVELAARSAEAEHDGQAHGRQNLGILHPRPWLWHRPEPALCRGPRPPTQRLGEIPCKLLFQRRILNHKSVINSSSAV